MRARVRSGAPVGDPDPENWEAFGVNSADVPQWQALGFGPFEAALTHGDGFTPSPGHALAWTPPTSCAGTGRDSVPRKRHGGAHEGSMWKRQEAAEPAIARRGRPPRRYRYGNGTELRRKPHDRIDVSDRHR
jgi:hypothetical protein